MHKLLRRQLAKVFGVDGSPPESLQPLVRVVDEAYTQFDLDRVLLERSLDLTSHELLEANRELRSYAAELEKRVAERTAELRAANDELALEIAERIAAEKAVGESEERYRSLFESSKDAIYISTPGGRLIDINPAGLELFGFDTIDEMLEVDVGRDLYLRPGDRRAFLDRVDHEGFVRDGELEMVHTDGSVLTVLATTTAVRNDDGEVVAYRGILRDVTVQRRFEQALIQAQKMEAVGRLAGGVAHDFNNLLTAILGYSELLAARVSDGSVRADAEAISAAAARGAELTSRLLAFGRRQVLQPIVLDLNRVLRDTRQLLRRVIPENVEIVMELDPELEAVEADRTQIEQVVVNLAINAGDAMPDGGRLTLRTDLVVPEPGPVPAVPIPGRDRWVRLSVVDTGVGIDDALQEHVFEPFFTTKDAARGTGLGLATVYTAVTESGGYVELTSRTGEGTRFDVYLPAAGRPPADVETVPESPRLVGGRERLLLVEDDHDVQQVLRGILEDRGYSVLAASDGLAGLDLARRHGRELDLVVTDVVMPNLNGIELALRIRRESPAMKVLLISGYAEDQARAVEGSLAGPHCAFLQKPFTPDTLLTAVRTLLEARS